MDQLLYLPCCDGTGRVGRWILRYKNAGKFHQVQNAVEQLLKHVETDWKVQIKMSSFGDAYLDP